MGLEEMSGGALRERMRYANSGLAAGLHCQENTYSKTQTMSKPTTCQPELLSFGFRSPSSAIPFSADEYRALLRHFRLAEVYQSAEIVEVLFEERGWVGVEGLRGVEGKDICDWNILSLFTCHYNSKPPTQLTNYSYFLLIINKTLNYCHTYLPKYTHNTSTISRIR